MTGFETESQTRSGRKGRLRRLFRERELILRSDGRVWYLRLRRGPQMTAAAAALGAVLWFAGVSGFAYVQQVRIDWKQAQIVEARVAYEALRSEVRRYQERVAALARAVLGRTGENSPEGAVDLTELTQVTSGIETTLERIDRDLDITETDRNRIIQARDSLHARIATLERQLADAETGIVALKGDVDARDRQLALARGTIGDLTGNRDEWRDRAATLDGDLAAARDRIGALESELETTVATLSAERARVEDLSDIRGHLSRQVDTLDSGLKQAEIRGEQLAAHVAQLTESLSVARHERMAMDGERRSLASDLAAAEATLSLHQAATARIRDRLKTAVLQLAGLTGRDTGMNDDETGILRALETQIAELSAELRGARTAAANMETAIGKVVVGLARIAGDSPTRPDVPGTPDDKVVLIRELLDAVARVQEDQLATIDRLTQETDNGIAQNEEILHRAGLDVDAVLRVSGYEPGVGGPFEPVASLDPSEIHPTETHPVAGGRQDGASALASDVAVLDSRLSRMSALNRLMRCVPLISPVDNFQVTSPFGPRKDPFTGRLGMHEGIDIGGWSGIPVHATAPGVVTFAGRNDGYGLMVEIDHGCGIKTVYAHLRRLKVERGEQVKHRAVVGTMGSTGRSTGPHLHYEVVVNGKAMDPEAFIKAGRYVHKI